MYGVRMAARRVCSSVASHGAGVGGGGAARRCASTNGLLAVTRATLEEIKAAGTYKVERVITSPQAGHIKVQSGGGKEVLNFCANNYTGFANHPEVVAAAKRALETHGFGLSSVRFICGTQDLHKSLEKEVAAFHGMEDSILFPSCFDANAGVFEALLSKEDAVISDSLNHASIIDGIRLCKAQKHVYNHMDMTDLETKLKATQSARVRLIATDGVFSMDGDVAPLKDIIGLARKYDAQVFVDECHATGFFGATGRGSDEYCGVRGEVDIINSTLGKALGGGTGGYTTSKREIVDLLRQKARPYLFSNSIAPTVAGASLKVFELLQRDTSFVSRVRTLTHRFRDSMTALGFTLKGSYDHPICPVMLGDAKLASYVADEMLKRGVYVIGFSFPVVPKGQARIRTQISAAHTEADIDWAVKAFEEVGRAAGIIGPGAAKVVA